MKSVETLNPFNPQTFVTDKYSILDVKATDESGKIFAIEFQTTEHAAFVNRILYYWAKTYCRQMESGNLYSVLRPVVSIAVTSFLLFKRLPKLHIRFT